MNTTFIFWQNILSIHQSAFLRNLAEKHRVILVTETGVKDSRLQQGWHVPDFGKTELFVAPQREQINKLLDIADTIHIFTGLHAFKLPTLALQTAIKKRLPIGIMSEPFNWLGWKGKLRYIKYVMLRIKYGKYIRFILTIGNRGRWCFEVTGFRKDIIYDWAYFTEIPDISNIITYHKKPQLIFIGRIDKNKNILFLVSICKRYKNSIDKLIIIGNGPLKEELLLSISDTDFEYMETIPNEDIFKILTLSDLLVLPSRYKDGWGAVVNEALMCGVPVVVSDNCGSSVLVGNNRGRIFSVKENNLEDVLSEFIPQLPYDMNKKQQIREWALANISGETASIYFISIIEHSLNKTKKKPTAPWMNN